MLIHEIEDVELREKLKGICVTIPREFVAIIEGDALKVCGIDDEGCEERRGWGGIPDVRLFQEYCEYRCCNTDVFNTARYMEVTPAPFDQAVKAIPDTTKKSIRFSAQLLHDLVTAMSGNPEETCIELSFDHTDHAKPFHVSLYPGNDFPSDTAVMMGLRK